MKKKTVKKTDFNPSVEEKLEAIIEIMKKHFPGPGEASSIIMQIVKVEIKSC